MIYAAVNQGFRGFNSKESHLSIDEYHTKYVDSFKAITREEYISLTNQKTALTMTEYEYQRALLPY